MTSMLETVITGTQPMPPRVMIYGTHGIGKSTLAAQAAKPIFIQTEDGLAEIDCAKFPLSQSLDDVYAAIGALYQEEHGYETAVVDTVDWLEQLIWQQVCADHGVKSIEAIGYGKGYKFALTHWSNALDGLNALRDQRGMAVILLAHAGVSRFENPETDAYDRYTPRLHKTASAMVQEWCDAVLFATYEVHTTQTDEGFNKRRNRAIGDGERVLRCQERPYQVAKNRYDLPPELPLSWQAVVDAIAGQYEAPATGPGQNSDAQEETNDNG